MSEPARALGASARGGSVLLAGSIVSKVLRLGHDLLLARVLGPAGFGVVAAAASLVGFLGEIALVGSHRAALRFASLGSGGAGLAAISRRAMAIPAAIGLTFAAAIALARVPLTRLLFGDAVSPWILPAFALASPAVGLLSVSQFMARARRRFVVDTFVGDVCRTGLPFVGTLFAFAVQRTLSAAAWGFVGGLAATVAIGVLLRGRSGGGDTGGRGSFGETAGAPGGRNGAAPTISPSFGRLLRVGAPLALGSASIVLLSELDKVMLAAFRPEEEVGVYNAAFRIARQILLVMPALNAAISPWVAPLLAEGRVDELRALYKRTVQWSLAAGWSATLLFCGFSSDFLGLFGDDYRAGAHVLVVVCLGHLVNAAAGTVAVVIQYSGHERKELFNGLLVMTTCVALNFALIPRFGALGAAYASFLVLTLVNTLRMAQAWRILAVMPYDRGTIGVLGAGAGGLALGAAAKAALAAAAGGGLSPVLGVVTACAGMAAAWVVYFAVVGVSAEEAKLLRLPRRFVKRARERGGSGAFGEAERGGRSESAAPRAGVPSGAPESSSRRAAGAARARVPAGVSDER